MKKLTFALLLVFMACQSGPKQFPWSEASFNEVLAQADGRLVLVEFFTDW